jgi:hypothetical protein
MAGQRWIAGRWRRNARKRPGEKIPQVSSNLDGVRHRAKSLRPATAKAAMDEKGPEVIPSDDNDEQGDEATSTMPTKPRKGGRTTPVGKTLSAGRTAPGRDAKPRLGAASNETWAVARAGMPTAAHLTMDGNNEDVNVATAIERGLARTTALGNDRIIGGAAPAGKLRPPVRRHLGRPPSYALGRCPTERGRSRRQECPRGRISLWTTTTRTSTLQRPANVASP